MSGNLNDFERLLQKKTGFIKVHRSYIVNLQWVQELRQGEIVTVTGRRLPVARAAYADVRTAYTEFLFDEVQRSEQAGEGEFTC